MKKILISMSLGLILALLGGAYATGSYLYVLFKEPISVDSSKASTLLIPLGTPFQRVTEQLNELGLIRHPRIYRYLSKYLKVASRIRAGEFKLRHEWNTWQLLQHLTSGKSIIHRITIPEGWNYEKIAKHLEAKGLVNRRKFLSLFRNQKLIEKTGISEAKSLEGFLFPETYFFSKIDSERRILETMILQNRKIFNYNLRKRAKELGWKVYDVLILASIIEKETGSEKDRPMIASVFHNRIKRRMRLDSDPTVIYGLENFNGNLTRKDLRTPTPYNTYLHSGLPPTPICSPGKDSLYSALYPAEVSYLYFVGRGDGSSKFSKTLKEHNKAVDYFQKNRKVRQMMREKRKQNIKSSKL